MKLKKTLIAASIAGAAVPLSLLANDGVFGVTPHDGATFPNAVSEADNPPSRVIARDSVDMYGDADISASTGYSDASVSEPAPDSVTWFYPDGRVYEQHGAAFVEVPDASSSTAFDSSGESLDMSDASAWSDPEVIAFQVVEPVQPDYLIIVQ